jgi:hypothetical protein
VKANTSATRKAKGSRAEKAVAERYRYHKVDETAQRQPMSGAMAHFKGDIHKRFDYEYLDEVKNHETINLGKFWEQAVDQCSGLRTPVLHITSNYRPIVTVLRTSDFEGLAGDDRRRFDKLDITHLKRFAFWDYAKDCHDPVPRAMVIHCRVRGEDLTMMTIDTYMILRKENL